MCAFENQISQHSVKIIAIETHSFFSDLAAHPLSHYFICGNYNFPRFIQSYHCEKDTVSCKFKYKTHHRLEIDFDEIDSGIIKGKDSKLTK